MSTIAVVFPIGRDHYAVDSVVVREVVADVRPTRLPTAPAVLLGVFNLRGEVVPMFDTAALLGFGNLNPSDIAIVVTLPAGPAGLMVGALPKLETLESPVGQSELRGTLGAFDIADGIAVLLDVEQLLLPHTNLTVMTARESVTVL